MGRFSPTVDPISGLEVLAEGLHSYADERERNRRLKRQEGREDLEEAAALASARDIGVRGGTAPTRTETVQAPPIFRGERIGIGRGARDVGMFEGQRPGAAGAIEAARRMGRPREPQLVARAGAYVPGVGFAPKNLYDTDVQEAVGMQRPETREAEDPRYEQLNDAYYLDTEETPDARRDRAQSDRRSRTVGVLQGIQRAGRGAQLDPELLAQAMELDVDPEDAFGAEPEPETITMAGRTFPATETGQRAALAWRTAVSEATRAPTGPDSQARITGEVTRRTFALAASRAVQGIRDEVRDASAVGRRFEPGEVERQINETLRFFGYRTVEELQDEARELRLAGVGGTGDDGSPTTGSADGSGGARELTDEELDQLILDNPDATDEELLELIGRGG